MSGEFKIDLLKMIIQFGPGSRPYEEARTRAEKVRKPEPENPTDSVKEVNNSQEGGPDANNSN